MTADQAKKFLEPVAPSLRAAFPVRGIVVAESGIAGALGGDADVILIVTVPVSHRVRLRMPGGSPCDVFVEDESSVVRAIERGAKDHIVRMLAEGTLTADDDDVVLRLQHRAREALSRARPENAAANLQAMNEPADLLRKLECHRREHVVAQLLYGQLLIALLRSRLSADHVWAVPTARLLEENRRIDPLLAGWIAVAARRPFSAEMLPAIRERVRGVVERFPGHRDVLTVDESAEAEPSLASVG